MPFHLSIVTLVISCIVFHQTHGLVNLADWSLCKEEKLTSDVVALAQSHVSRNYGLKSPSIEVTKMEKKILLGTNIRLHFVVDGKKKCQLTAFKPWSLIVKPLELKKCDCEDKTPSEKPVEPDWDVCNEDKTVSEMVGLANTHISRKFNVKGPVIRAIQLKKRILQGTHLRFQFLLDGKKKCELTAVRPWLFTRKPLEVKSCDCEDQKDEKPVVPDWEVTEEENLLSEIVTAAHSHVRQRFSLSSPVIQSIQLKKQILDGTNLRFQFLIDGKKKCDLTAFKPWAHTFKPIEVKECSCEEENVKEPVVADWEDCDEDKSVSEVVDLAQKHVVKNYGVAAPLIKVLEFKKQLVSGTNFRLRFLFDGKKKCQLNAFKPLPQTNKPIEVKDCTCEDKNEGEEEPKSSSSEEKKH